MIVMMKDFGNSLVTRAAGRSAYENITARMAESQEIAVFDFSNVDSITNSFADEVFGRMAFELGFDQLRKSTSFTNISPFWASVIRSVIDERVSDRALTHV